MAEQKTTLVYEAKAKGFAETKRAIDETNRAANSGPEGRPGAAGAGPGAKAAVGIDALNTHLAKLSRTISHDLMRSLGQVEKAIHRIAQATGGTPTPPPLAPPPAGSGGAGGGGTGGGGSIGGGPGGSAPASAAARGAAKGSLTQGLLEGLLSGNLTRLIQRGPGAMTQAAGIVAGQSLRGVAGSAASFLTSSLHGSAGLQQALAGLPVVGGILAERLGMSQRGVDFERQKFGDSFLLGQGFAPSPPSILMAGEQGRLGAMARRRVGGLGAVDAGRLFDPLADVGASPKLAEAQRIVEQEMLDTQTRAHGIGGAQRSMRGRDNAQAGQRQRMLEGLKGIGRNTLGEDLPSTLNFATGVSGGAGMALGTANDPLGLVRRAAQLSSVYGIRPEVSGTFEGGFRNNAMSPSSAKGSSVGQLDAAMRDAVASGLDGTGLTDYMEQMAGDIRSFAQSGIPVAPASVMQMAETARGVSGVGLQRSIGIAQGAQASGRALGQSGPTNAAEALRFQYALGDKPLTAGSYFETRKRLLNGDADLVQSDQRMLVDRYKAMMGPGGFTQEKHGAAMSGVMALAAQSGSTMNVNELEDTMLGATQEPGNAELADAKRSRQRAYASRNTRTYAPGDAAAKHALAIPSATREADIANLQLKSGEAFAPIATKLDKSMETLASSVTQTVVPALSGAVDEMLKFTKVLSDLAAVGTEFLKRASQEGMWDAMHDPRPLHPSR